MTQSLLDRIKAKRQAIAAKSNFDRPLKLKSDKNLIRILPNWAGDPEGSFYHDFGQHFIKDDAGTTQAVYICTANTFGKPCQVCAAVADAAAHLSPEDTAGARQVFEARGSSRVLVNAIYMNGSHPNAKTDPVLLELPPTVFDQILGIAEDYASNHDINIFAVDAGYDVTVSKTGSGRDTKYSTVPSPKPRALDASVLSKCKNLDDFVKQEYEPGLQNALVAVRTHIHGAVGALPAPSTADNFGGPGMGGVPAIAPPVAAAAGMPTGQEFIPAARPAANLAATMPLDMDEAPVADQPLKVTSNVTTESPGSSSAASEIDELEALLNDPALKAA